MPADELRKISCITFKYLQLNSIVFYEVTEASHCANACIIYCIQQTLISPLVISTWHLTPTLCSDFTTPFPSVYLTCAPPHIFVQCLFYNFLVLSTPWSVAGCIVQQITNCTSELNCTTCIISGLVSFGCQMILSLYSVC